MNIKCLFGFHKWKKLDTFSRKYDKTDYGDNLRECIRCGKSQILKYDMTYGESYWD